MHSFAGSFLFVVQVGEHLDVLVQTVPEWAEKISIRKRTYLKIDKNKDLKVIIAEVQKQARRLQAP